MKAFGPNLLILPQEEKKSKGGIILTGDSGPTTLKSGKVVSVGNGQYLNSEVDMSGVKEGDTVFYLGRRGYEYKINGTTHIVLQITEILGIE